MLCSSILRAYISKGDALAGVSIGQQKHRKHRLLQRRDRKNTASEEDRGRPIGKASQPTGTREKEFRGPSAAQPLGSDRPADQTGIDECSVSVRRAFDAYAPRLLRGDPQISDLIGKRNTHEQEHAINQFDAKTMRPKPR